MYRKGDILKRIFILIISSIIIILPNKIKAECSDSEMIRLSNVAKNINVTYTYDETKNMFNLKFVNLTNEVILRDVLNSKNYNMNGELIISNYLSGKYKFSIYNNSKMCESEILVTKYIELPYLNRYYMNEKCKGIEDYSYCNKWINTQLSFERWNENVDLYLNSLKENKEEIKNSKDSIFDKIRKTIVDIYSNYYYIVLPVIIGMFIIIIYVKRRKDDLF